MELILYLILNIEFGERGYFEMDTIQKTCFFSGHRHLPEEKTTHIETILKEKIIEKYNMGIRIFISGGAYGFDTMAAKAVLQIKNELYSDISLYMYIPSYSYGENWTYDKRCELHSLRCMADKTEVIVKKQYIRGCMQIRNQRMVDDSCCGIAYLDSLYGGTKNTLSYAKRCGKPVQNIAELI